MGCIDNQTPFSAMTLEDRFVEQVAVFDALHTGFNSLAYGIGRKRMHRHIGVVGFGHLDDGLHFIERVLRHVDSGS